MTTNSHIPHNVCAGWGGSVKSGHMSLNVDTHDGHFRNVCYVETSESTAGKNVKSVLLPCAGYGQDACCVELFGTGSLSTPTFLMYCTASIKKRSTFHIWFLSATKCVLENSWAFMVLVYSSTSTWTQKGCLFLRFQNANNNVCYKSHRIHSFIKCNPLNAHQSLIESWKLLSDITGQ